MKIAISILFMFINNAYCMDGSIIYNNAARQVIEKSCVKNIKKYRDRLDRYYKTNTELLKIQHDINLKPIVFEIRKINHKIVELNAHEIQEIFNLTNINPSVYIDPIIQRQINIQKKHMKLHPKMKLDYYKKLKVLRNKKEKLITEYSISLDRILNKRPPYIRYYEWQIQSLLKKCK